MIFLQVHFISGTLLNINADSIVSFWRSDVKGDCKYTIIRASKYEYMVKETPGEIIEMLGRALS